MRMLACEKNTPDISQSLINEEKKKLTSWISTLLASLTQLAFSSICFTEISRRTNSGSFSY